MPANQQQHFSSGAGILELWVGLLLAPLVWWLHLEINYVLVPFACARHSHLLLHGVTLISLLIAGSGLLVAWRNWEKVGRTWPDSGAGAVSRSRFMAVGGILSSGMFLLVILAQGITAIILNPCQT